MLDKRSKIKIIMWFSKPKYTLTELEVLRYNKIIDNDNNIIDNDNR